MPPPEGTILVTVQRRRPPAKNLHNPVLTGLLEDFEAGIAVLQEYQGEEHHKVAKSLCELSRDIRFRLGPPQYLLLSQLRRVVTLFEAAVEKIRPEGNALVQAYQKHIRERGEAIRQTFGQAISDDLEATP